MTQYLTKRFDEESNPAREAYSYFLRVAHHYLKEHLQQPLSRERLILATREVFDLAKEVERADGGLSYELDEDMIDTMATFIAMGDRLGITDEDISAAELPYLTPDGRRTASMEISLTPPSSRPPQSFRPEM